MNLVLQRLLHGLSGQPTQNQLNLCSCVSDRSSSLNISAALTAGRGRGKGGGDSPHRAQKRPGNRPSRKRAGEKKPDGETKQTPVASVRAEDLPLRGRRGRSSEGAEPRPGVVRSLSYDDTTCKSQTSVGGSGCEGPAVSPARRVHRSRLIPPRPIRELLLDKVTATNRQNVLMLEKAKPQAGNLTSDQKQEDGGEKSDRKSRCQSSPSSRKQQAANQISQKEKAVRGQRSEVTCEDTNLPTGRQSSSQVLRESEGKASEDEDKNQLDQVQSDKGVAMETLMKQEEEGAQLQEAGPGCKEQETPPQCVCRQQAQTWTGLENLVHFVLRGLVQNQSLVSEMCRTGPGPGSGSVWGLGPDQPLRKDAAEQTKPSLEDTSVLETLDAPSLQKQTRHVVVVSSVSRCEGGEDVQDFREPPGPGAAGRVSTAWSCDVGGANSSPQERQSGWDSTMASCYEEFVFVESYFAEPEPHQSPEEPSEPSSEDDQLIGHEANCPVGQRSKVRRILEDTAEEIRTMVVPELTLLSPEDRRVQGHPRASPWIQASLQIQALPESNAEDVLVEDMDSCEEADEDEEEHHPAAKAVVRAMSSVRVGVVNRKKEHKPECRIS